jgi:HSP20 family molecular chaperone IbpA
MASNYQRPQNDTAEINRRALKVEAKFDKGVLYIHLPKPAEVAKKQQKIEIKKA